MQNLQFPYQLRRCSAQPLWDLRRRCRWILLGNLIFSQCIIHEWLDRLLGVNFTGEDIVKAELSWEHVHHHVYGILLRACGGH